jgi:tetratricopeptide (TPR) repeat protein
MPLLVLSGDEAMANVKSNAAQTWPARGEAGSRLEPLARPALHPGFRFNAGERIFTIGSCFARNVEVVLEQCGFVIPTRDIIRADEAFGRIGHNILNNYGAPSILNEIRWALDPAHPFAEEQAFFEIYPGKWVDAHLNHALKPTTLAVVRARRKAILAAYQALRECRVVIITLGLAECWFDRETGFYLNTAPRRSMIRSFPGRFELRVLSYEEVHAAVREAMALIRSHGVPDVRVILTVSPVPLSATFRADDVMVANCYSKSVLRTAAEAITLTHDFVDYYPSYESVTLSERVAAIEDDQVHPTRDVIALNTSRLVKAYVGSGASEDEGIRDAIAENPQAALLLATRPDLVEAEPELAAALFAAAGRAGRLDALAMAIPHLAGTVPEDEIALARARIALGAGDNVGALALLTAEPARRAARGSYWATRLEALIAIGDLAGAHVAAQAWAEANVRTPEPFRRLALALAAKGRHDEAEAMFHAALAVADHDPKTMLDFVEMLHAANRREEALGLIDQIVPANPAQTERLARLRLWSGGAVNPDPAAFDAEDPFPCEDYTVATR